MGETDDIDLTDRALYANGVPHEVFTRLRGAGSVHRHHGWVGRPRRDLAYWSVVGHAEIQQVNRDWEMFTALDGPNLAVTTPERCGHWTRVGPRWLAVRAGRADFRRRVPGVVCAVLRRGR